MQHNSSGISYSDIPYPGIPYSGIPYSGSARLLIFTKIPGAAPCKTRLKASTPLSDAEVTALATAFLYDTIATAASAVTEMFNLSTFPEISLEQLTELFDSLPSSPELPLTNISLALHSQQGSGFGARLQHSVYRVFEQTQEGVVVIGTDSPTLCAGTLVTALESIDSGRMVLGPTTGGGVYLIGFPRKLLKSGFDASDIFSNPHTTELQMLGEKAALSGVETLLLEPHFDVDTGSDLLTLISILASLTETKTQTQSFSEAKASKAVLDMLEIEVARNKNDNRRVDLKRRLHK